jgi:hypothetical protein
MRPILICTSVYMCSISGVPVKLEGVANRKGGNGKYYICNNIHCEKKLRPKENRQYNDLYICNACYFKHVAPLHRTAPKKLIPILSKTIIPIENSNPNEKQHFKLVINNPFISNPTPTSVQTLAGEITGIGHELRSHKYTYDPLLDSIPTYQTHGWNINNFTIISKTVCNQWDDYYLTVKHNKRKWIGIRGNQNQLDILELKECASVRTITLALFEESMKELNIDINILELVALKLLRAEPKYGQQPPHCDTTTATGNCISILMNIRLCKHTALPLLPLERMKVALEKDNIAEQLIKPVNYTSKQIEKGNVLIFHDDVIHFGVENESDTDDRVMVFALYKPKGMQLEYLDTMQVYPIGENMIIQTREQEETVKQEKLINTENKSKSENDVSLSATNNRSIKSFQSTKSFNELESSQQRKRKRIAIEALTEIGIPPEELISSTPTTPIELIHLSQSVRKKIRTVDSIEIPCEKTIRLCKNELKYTHGTATNIFDNGAYLTDPIRFVNSVSSGSPHIIIGGDAGGGHTKLGITYINKYGVSTFAALLVYAGKDDWSSLNQLRQSNLTPFEGDSINHPHIFSILQHLINSYNSFLNGDWPFLTTLLGLMGPSATHPCPICTVGKQNLLSLQQYRNQNLSFSNHAVQTPLITISSDRIVPTPLHVILGISNHIIFKVLKKFISEDKIINQIKRIKTLHSPGFGGLSDLYELNGPEINKWIKYNCASALFTDPSITNDLIRNTIIKLNEWIRILNTNLLHIQPWNNKMIDEFNTQINSITQEWLNVTQTKPFPKLHMLLHSIQFIKKWNKLGQLSESQIESYHAQFNQLFHIQHKNQSNNIAERLRRSLADASLKAIQPNVTS